VGAQGFVSPGRCLVSRVRRALFGWICWACYGEQLAVLCVCAMRARGLSMFLWVKLKVELLFIASAQVPLKDHCRRSPKSLRRPHPPGQMLIGRFSTQQRAATIQPLIATPLLVYECDASTKSHSKSVRLPYSKGIQSSKCCNFLAYLLVSCKLGTLGKS